MPTPSESTRINRDFFERAYARGFITSLIKQFASYDQLSKTRRNLAVARGVPGFGQELSVLDYGFGHGTFLLRLPRRHHIAGVELSDSAVRNVLRLSSFVRRPITLYTPGELATLPSSSFDLICCSHVLEHVDDDRALLVEFRRLLTQQGHLLINVPINEVWDDPNHVRSYDASAAVDLLESAGFVVEQNHQADRWTALLLEREQTSQRMTRLMLRAARLGLALLPARVLAATERLLPTRYEPQQLILLARAA
jgi:SAM-dependent methyltransferase